MIQVETNAESSFICKAHDPNRDPLTYQWIGTTASSTSQNNTSIATYTPTADGIATISCTVSDGRGGLDQRAVEVKAVTTSNHPPTLSLAAASPSTPEDGADVITATASDPDNDAITYSFFVTAGTGTISQSQTDATKATFTAPAVPETDTILCVAADGKGGVKTAVVTITVP